MEKQNRVYSLLIYFILTLGVIITTTPMLYMLSTSFRPNGALYEYPPKLIPDVFTLENYKYVLFKVNFYKNFLNSLIVALCTVLLAAFVSSTLAYCIARFDFIGKKLLFGLIMTTMIIPGMTLIIPQFELIVWLKLINKLFGLIPVYVSWVVPFSTFMIKGFIEDIPKDFDDAIYIDGGTVFTVYNKIMLPLASPAVAAVSIFNFLIAWEEYPWALTVINDVEKRTLPIAISGFFGQHNFTQWGYVFAMSVISLIPVIVIFIACQKFFVTGLSAGAIKG
ncbi:carbohydrate ABC transporter permease [Petroclostridium xylanilyticum]|uniref:carbohydrate ABC transporter permease n=1 Tax=Petroclostridium xylanilyticum TaxID=1792311 RepID=UPI001FA8D38C|nr:carbohydrate ABC transporter permease [Petroclostridium xylanilyticum]